MSGMTPYLQTNQQRIERDIEHIASLGATGTSADGRTSFTYSLQDLKVRKYLLDIFEELGLSVFIDGVGNIRARYAGSNPDASVVMSGSHVDSVRRGGKYDGVVGVIGALEAIRVMKENNITPSHPIEVVIFSEEEGSNFGSCCAGSKAMVGRYTFDDLNTLKNLSGQSMYDLAKNAGYDPDNMPRYVLNNGGVKAMVELHIEQSPMLHSVSMPIGVVEAIAGLRQIRVEVDGIPNHAGATPMNFRQDALLGAAHMISAVEEAVQTKGTESTVGTVGYIESEPNVSNIIPGKVVFSIDIRDVYQQPMNDVVEEVRKRFDEIAQRYNLTFSMTLLGEQEAVQLSQEVISSIEKSAQALGIPYKKMNSGAVHDAVLLCSVAEVGLIFVPSVDGRSHCPEEYTSYEDIKRGADLLLATLLDLAK